MDKGGENQCVQNIHQTEENNKPYMAIKLPKSRKKIPKGFTLPVLSNPEKQGIQDRLYSMLKRVIVTMIISK